MKKVFNCLLHAASTVFLPAVLYSAAFIIGRYAQSWLILFIPIILSIIIETLHNFIS